MSSEKIIIYRTNEDSTKVEQYPKTITSQVFDVNKGQYLDEAIQDIESKIGDSNSSIKVLDGLPSDYSDLDMFFTTTKTEGIAPETTSIRYDLATRTSNGLMSSTDKFRLDHISMMDTRSTNEKPFYYWELYSKARVFNEFKLSATIGIPNAPHIYCSLETRVSWSDASGGAINQIAYCEANIYIRRSIGTGESAYWDSWKKVSLTTA